MKKLKQLWAILGMVKKFLPRFLVEFKDIKTLIDDIKYEWFLTFPPKETYVELEEEIPWKARSKGASTMFRDEIEKPEKLVQFPGPKLERSDEVPDGHSYFKKKEGE